jgi:hypothetical protein
MTAGTSASVESCAVFVAAVVTRIADVTASIASLIGVEVGERVVSARWKRSGITVVGIPAVVDVAVKAAGTMEPWSRADEEATHEPIWSVIAIGSAVIGCVVKVAVRTNGGSSNAYCNLGRRFGSNSAKETSEHKQAKSSKCSHVSPLEEATRIRKTSCESELGSFLKLRCQINRQQSQSSGVEGTFVWREGLSVHPFAPAVGAFRILDQKKQLE